MTNNDRTIARLDRMMRAAVLALMATEAGLAPGLPVGLPRAESVGWPRADKFDDIEGPCFFD